MFSRHFWHQLRLVLGIEANTTTHSEKWISILGGILGIFAVYLITEQTLKTELSALIIVTSMGATAVLVFAIPQGALSQPWAVLGGHLISAFVGVSCQKLFPGHLWTPALAVGFAIGAMHYCRCLHPPGGATALAAVIGGESVYTLGYHYMLAPVLLNVLIILFVAVAFNGLFSWRVYPAHFSKRLREAQKVRPKDRQIELTQEDFSAAMHHLNSYVGISSENLTELLELAKQHAEKNTTHPEDIIPGRFYSNGKLGNLWSVRQVLDASDEYMIPEKDKVIYKVLAGDQAYQTGICLRREFKQWARFEVTPKKNRWLKVDSEH